MTILKKMVGSLLAGAMLLSLFSGCSQEGGEITSGAAEKDYPVTVGGVTLKKEPDGVAVLSDNIADVILAMGYEICLKAKTAECTQSDLSVLPDVTAADPASIKETGASLVLTDEDLGQETKDAMNQAGLDVIVLSPAKSREDLERLYAEVGSAIKGGSTGYKTGETVAQNVFLTIDDVTRVLPDAEVPAVGCFLYDAQGAAATGDTLEGKLLEAAGMINGVDGGANGQVEFEVLRLADPQYIFCPAGVKEQLSSAENYKDLTAVKEGRVYEMEPGYMSRQGRSLVQAVIFMAGTLYPELLESEPSSEPSGSDQSSGASVPTESNPADDFVPGATLQSGDKGDAVLALQRRLDKLGYMFVAYAGEYTPGTVQAVKDFQYLNGIEVTGIADEETQKRIAADDAIPRTAES